MLCSPTHHLRSSIRTNRLSPSLLPACSYSTSFPLHKPCATRPSSKLGSSKPLNRRNAAVATPHMACIASSGRSAPSTKLQIRLASTTASPSSTSNAPNVGPTPGEPLTWNEFLRLRKVRRRYNLAASLVTSVATTGGGVGFLSQQDLDALGTQMFGLDPFVVLGLVTFGFGAVGWLLGPFVGNGVFGLVYRRFKGQIASKEREFYNRIKRYRVDPSSQSFANPVPDYYGEKIGSVKDYRQWLKDQRAYNKKKQSFLI